MGRGRNEEIKQLLQEMENAMRDVDVAAKTHDTTTIRKAI